MAWEGAVKQAIVGMVGFGLVAFGLTGCATYSGEAGSEEPGSGQAGPDQAGPLPAPAAMMCEPAPAQYHLGHDATQAMGAAILKDSGARTLRWGPPNSAWTMDYRQDRVNVRYDERMKILEITCG